MSGPGPLDRLWDIPILVGVLSAIGLIAALVDEGVGDIVGWVTLAVPVAAVGLCLWRARSTEREPAARGRGNRSRSRSPSG